MNRTIRNILFGTVALVLAGGGGGAKAAQNGTVSIPNFDAFIGSQPTYDIRPPFLLAHQILSSRKTGLPELENSYTCGYTPDGKFDPSIAKVQVESDVTGYFGIFQRVDDKDFAIIHPTSADPSKPINKWAVLGIVDGKYKAAICDSYDKVKGILGSCHRSQQIEDMVPSINLIQAGSFANETCSYHVNNAGAQGGFSPPPAPKPTEKNAYIDLQRSNFAQLVNAQ